MRPLTSHARLSLVLLAVALMGAGGCGPKATPGQKKVEGFAKTRAVLDSSALEVRSTVSAMNDLRRVPPEVSGDAFTRYKNAVARLEKQAADAKKHAKAMNDQGNEHIRKWQEEMKSITDPAIKASLESRRDAVKSNFALIQMYAQDVRKAYGPFLSGNKQMVQALSIDLSPATVSSLSQAMDRVAADGNALQQKITLMQQAMNNIAHGLSPIGL